MCRKKIFQRFSCQIVTSIFKAEKKLELRNLNNFSHFRYNCRMTTNAFHLPLKTLNASKYF